MSKTDAKNKVISLYSGAGGLDYGFEAAGFKTAVAVEWDSDCCSTLRASREWSVIERDIFRVPTSEMLAAADADAEEIGLLIGGPPCQPFSKAGYWATGNSKRLEDPRASTLDAYLRVIDEVRPHAFMLENVHGLAFSNKSEGLQLLLDRVGDINKRHGTRYKPRYQVINAADFGVPQLRERVFVVASRDGKEFQFPRPTHCDPSLCQSLDLLGVQAYRTAWDAIADVIPHPSEQLEVRGKWAALLPSIPEGQNYLWHTNRGGGRPLFGWRRRYWSFLLKLAKNRPSWTIQAQPGPAIGPFHWSNRLLSTRELARLQTFPDGLTLVGNRISVQRQLGNAVPSLLAEVLARSIRTQLLRLDETTAGPVLLPPDRGTPPPPEHVAEVPARYAELEGDHEAHPGTGLGNAARVRVVA